MSSLPEFSLAKGLMVAGVQIGKDAGVTLTGPLVCVLHQLW